MVHSFVSWILDTHSKQKNGLKKLKNICLSLLLSPLLLNKSPTSKLLGILFFHLARSHDLFRINYSSRKKTLVSQKHTLKDHETASIQFLPGRMLLQLRSTTQTILRVLHSQTIQSVVLLCGVTSDPAGI